MHCSATSHPPGLAGLQVLVLERKLSAGQVAVVPVQLSGTSHSPAPLRQTVELGERMSAGHTGVVPVQFSAGSQVP